MSFVTIVDHTLSIVNNWYHLFFATGYLDNDEDFAVAVGSLRLNLGGIKKLEIGCKQFIGLLFH